MEVYAVDKLMAETRRLAAEYYKATQQTLPVSAELARYDAMRYLGLHAPEQTIGGIDAIANNDDKIQIKARVIFKQGKGGYRIGQLSEDSPWDAVLLVLMDPNYDTTEIYELERNDAFSALDQQQTSNRSKRGAMSVAKFKALSQLIWSREEGLL